MGSNKALLDLMKMTRERLGESEGDPGAPGLVFKVQAGPEGTSEGSVKHATEAWTKGDAKDCFLCEGERYIPVTERAELGPVMFELDTFPEDWAACPECNAGAEDPSASVKQ